MLCWVSILWMIWFGSGFVDVVVDGFLFFGWFGLVGFLFFCLGLIFMFFDSTVVIWGFFSNGFFFCVCLPRKFMGLKAKVCFTGDMGLGFG